MLGCMTSWATFAAAEPEFADRVRGCFSRRKHATLATLRRDGSPRISGTEVEFVGDDVCLGMMPGSVKALTCTATPAGAPLPHGRPAGGGSRGLAG